MKKRPTWATVVGILGIVFSSFGILGAGQIIMTPKIMEFQKQMITTMTEQALPKKYIEDLQKYQDIATQIGMSQQQLMDQGLHSGVDYQDINFTYEVEHKTGTPTTLNGRQIDTSHFLLTILNN